MHVTPVTRLFPLSTEPHSPPSDCHDVVIPVSSLPPLPSYATPFFLQSNGLPPIYQKTFTLDAVLLRH